MESHLWLIPYPGPIPHLMMALKKGKPRSGLPSSLFLKISASPAKNVCIFGFSRKMKMQKVVGRWYGCQVWGTVFRWQKMRWSNEHVVPQSLIHWGPARICYLGPLWVSQRQKLQNVPSINFLLLNDFTHNIYKKEVCHEPYISSFGINNYKTNLFFCSKETQIYRTVI